MKKPLREAADCRWSIPTLRDDKTAAAAAAAARTAQAAVPASASALPLSSSAPALAEPQAGPSAPTSAPPPSPALSSLDPPPPPAAAPDLRRQAPREIVWHAGAAFRALIALRPGVGSPVPSAQSALLKGSLSPAERLQKAIDAGRRAAKAGASAFAARHPEWRLPATLAADLALGPAAEGVRKVSSAAAPAISPVQALSASSADLLLPHLSGGADGSAHAFGLAPVDPGALLRRHRAWAARIRTALGHEALFEAHALPAMLRWAAMVQSLPRAAEGLFAESDGLFLSGLMTAARALPLADRRPIGLDLPPRERRALEERVRLAALLAGLFCGLEVLIRLRIEAGAPDPQFGGFVRRAVWEPSAAPLLDFALAHAGEALRLIWRPAALAGEAWTGWRAERAAAEAVRASGGAPFPMPGTPEPVFAGRAGILHALARALPAETAAWLRGVPGALSALEGAVSGALMTSEAGRLVADALMRAKVRVFNERAMEAAARDAAHPVLEGWAAAAVHAAKTLLLEGRWLVNPKKTSDAFGGGTGGVPCAALWWGADGLFIPWPQAAKSILVLVRDVWGLGRFPSDPMLLAAILVRAGFAVPTAAGEPLHDAALPPGLAHLSLVGEGERPFDLPFDSPFNEPLGEAGGDADAGGGAPGAFRALLAAEPQPLVDLAAAWAAGQGEALAPLPERLLRRSRAAVPGLMPEERVGETGRPGLPGRASAMRLFWEASIPSGLPVLAAELLERAVREVSRREDAAALAMAEGLFLPADAFPPGQLQQTAEMLAAAGAVLRLPDGRLIARVRRLHSPRTLESIEEGVVLSPLCVRPRAEWPDGAAEDIPWPAPGRALLSALSSDLAG